MEHVLETFLYKLVCPTNEIKIVYVIELQRAKLFVTLETCDNFKQDSNSEPNKFPIPLMLPLIQIASLHLVD